METNQESSIEKSSLDSWLRIPGGTELYFQIRFPSKRTTATSRYMMKQHQMSVRICAGKSSWELWADCFLAIDELLASYSHHLLSTCIGNSLPSSCFGQQKGFNTICYFLSSNLPLAGARDSLTQDREFGKTLDINIIQSEISLLFSESTFNKTVERDNTVTNWLCRC